MTVLTPRRPAANRTTMWIDGLGSLRAVELLRIAAGPLVIAHLWPFLVDAVDGLVYSDRFYEPYASWYPEAARDLYVWLLWGAVVAAVALSAGLATRFTSVYVAAFVAYNLFLSRTHFWHNRAFLLVLLVGIALLPLGRAWSVDEWLRSRRGLARRKASGPLWPVLLMRLEVATVYAASGVSKLVDDDWWGGTVTRLRVVQWRDVAASRGVPDWLLDALATEGFHVWFAKVAVLTEIVIAVGFLTRRFRVGALWVAVWFHVCIEIVASVQVFSFAALGALLIWVTPSERDRNVIVAGNAASGRAIRRAVRWLDWTRRFELVIDPRQVNSITVVDRDRSAVHGSSALLFVLTRLPALFPFVAPFNLPILRGVWYRASRRFLEEDVSPAVSE